MTQFEQFMSEYEKQLSIAVKKYPLEYGFKPEVIPSVVEKMKKAFLKGSYNKEGRALKATCKALSIPYTYIAINQFISKKG